jgi:hypothetical protein
MLPPSKGGINLVQVETEADQLSREVTKTETHPSNINWEDTILPEQTTDVSHTVRAIQSVQADNRCLSHSQCKQTTDVSHTVGARNKATGVLHEHNYLILPRQHYLNINT